MCVGGGVVALTCLESMVLIMLVSCSDAGALITSLRTASEAGYVLRN